MEKSKISISNLPTQSFFKIKKRKIIKKTSKGSNYIIGNLDKDFLNYYFQESKK